MEYVCSIRPISNDGWKKLPRMCESMEWKKRLAISSPGEKKLPKVAGRVQVCTCGSDQPPFVAITIFGQSVRISPRIKTQAQTVYVCPLCCNRLNQRTRETILAAVLGAAAAITDEIRDTVQP